MNKTKNAIRIAGRKNRADRRKNKWSIVTVAILVGLTMISSVHNVVTDYGRNISANVTNLTNNSYKNVSKGIQHYNITHLDSNAQHVISTQTVGRIGGSNNKWTNDTEWTSPIKTHVETPIHIETYTLKTTPLSKEYKLIWNDEFDEATLDTNKWFEQGPICSPWYPNILPENVLLDGNGNLVLESTKDTNGYYGGGVASMCDDTGEKKFDFKYGYIEIRAKSADTNQINGIGTSLWLSSSIRWPPEIDITESGSGPVDTVDSDGVTHSVNAMKMTRHCNTDDSNCDGDPEYDSGLLVGRQKESSTYIHDSSGNPVDLSKDFHIYGLEWTPTYISWLLDGVEQFRVTTGVPQEMMYIMLNISPGNWGGGPVQSNTPFPSNTYVDYVRVYQKSKHRDMVDRPSYMNY